MAHRTDQEKVSDEEENEKDDDDGDNEESDINFYGANGKPKRPCLICGKFQTNLTRHLKSKHKSDDEVKMAMQLEPRDRNQAFAVLRRKGYHKYNLDKLKEADFDETKLLKERKPRKDRDGEIEKRAMCSSCKGFFVKEHMKSHKMKCSAAEGCTRIPIAIPTVTIRDEEYTEEYKEDILCSFWDDQTGQFIRSDKYIKDFGFHYFRQMSAKKDKSQQNRKNLTKHMRTLANLFFFVNEQAEKLGKTVSSFTDLIERENFFLLMDGINAMSAKDEGGEKSGLKKNVGHLLQNVITHMKGLYMLENRKDEMDKVDVFKTLLDYYKGELFSSAEYNCKRNRQENLRRPQNLPLQNDIDKLRKYILSEIKRLEGPFAFLEPNDYTLLRDVVVTRLTLFHGKRGGEPSRLTFKEWNDAFENSWVDENQKKKVKIQEELVLFEKYKLTYQAGKCVSHMLPVLIPEDSWKAITKLTDLQVRQAAGVKENNIYVFPHIKDSNFHVCGWKSVNKTCKMAGLSKGINATQMRHYISTVFASMDVPAAEREAFYRHMGHSEEINKHVYQCPLAVQEITKVGKFLHNLFDKEADIDPSGDDTTVKEQPQSQEKVAGPSSRVDNGVGVGEEVAGPSSLVDNGVGENGFTESRNSAEQREKRKFVIHSSSEDDYSPESDESLDGQEELKQQNRGVKRQIEDEGNEKPEIEEKKKRRNVQWNEEDTEIVRSYFTNYVNDYSKEGSQGAMPGFKLIEKFMNTYPNVMAQETDFITRRDIIKAKVFNERNKARKNFQERKKKFCF